MTLRLEKNQKAMTLRLEKEFNIDSVKLNDEGNYTCRGRRSDSQLSQMSDPVTLSVSEKPKPELTSSLTGDVLTGNSVTLTCTLKLQSNGWKFYWNASTNSTETETAANYDNSSSSSSSSSSHYYSHYNITSVSVPDGGQYRCRAGRGDPVYYTNYSDALWVNVTASPKPAVNVETKLPVYRGENVTLSCDINGGGDPEWTYKWFMDDTPVSISHTTHKISVVSDDGGKYTCRGKRKSDSQHSQKSDPPSLTVSEKPKPVITSSPEGDVLTGNSVTLTCRLNVQPDGWKFYWTTPTQSKETETEAQHSSPSYSSHHTITPVSVSDGGQYRCRAGRGTPVYYTLYSDDLSLSVIASPKPVVNVETKLPVYRGESVTLRCDIKGGGDTEWTYEWFMNNSPVSPSHTTQRITVVSDDGGKYTCRGKRSDSQLSVKSNPPSLSVLAFIYTVRK
ncbi:B-cell receptor CD22-like [Clarias gariepinus]